MQKEYSNIGKEYFESDYDESRLPKEFLESSANVELLEEKEITEKYTSEVNNKMHKQIARKMVYGIASAVTIFSLAATIHVENSLDLNTTDDITIQWPQFSWEDFFQSNKTDTESSDDETGTGVSSENDLQNNDVQSNNNQIDDAQDENQEDGNLQNSNQQNNINVHSIVITGTDTLTREMVSQKLVEYGENDRLKVTIQGVSAIGKEAFEGCDILLSVVIPEGVTTIGTEAFNNCKLLETVHIPNSVQLIKDMAFSGCNSLVIDKLITTNRGIAARAFADVTIRDLEISESISVSSFLVSSFSGANVEHVSFEEGITLIPSYCLWNCTTIKEVVIPDTVISIGTEAFEDCVNLERVIIPDSVVQIKDNAFFGCEKLKIDTFSTRNRTMGISIFNGAHIGEVIISDTYQVSGFGNIFTGSMSGANITTLSFETGITLIPACALAGCNTIKEVIIPNTVIEIGEDAFKNCEGLVRVVIPESVQLIRTGAFQGCSNLTDIEMLGTVADIRQGAFDE